jgi:hypothetical protein
VGMRGLPFVVATLAVTALAACGDGSGTPTGGAAITGVTVQLRGEVVARNLCARCHGPDFQGRNMGSLVTPSLSVARNYSRDEFSRLLGSGVARDGHQVHEAMAATRSISEDGRQGVYEFLVLTLP